MENARVLQQWALDHVYMYSKIVLSYNILTVSTCFSPFTYDAKLPVKISVSSHVMKKLTFVAHIYTANGKSQVYHNEELSNT